MVEGQASRGRWAYIEFIEAWRYQDLGLDRRQGPQQQLGTAVVLISELQVGTAIMIGFAAELLTTNMHQTKVLEYPDAQREADGERITKEEILELVADG